MMKDFNLFKFILIFSVIGLVVAGVSTADFSDTASFSEFMEAALSPLELTNLHYFALLYFIWRYGGRR